MSMLLFMDVDGTLTDGGIYLSNSGLELKKFNVKDGYAIKNIFPAHSIIPVIITGRDSEIVTTRCKELGITEIYQNCDDKRKKMIEICDNFGVEINSCGKYEKAAYIGDDLPDLECMLMSKYSGCPSDAVDEVKIVANFVSEYNGGNGALRDFVKWILTQEG